MVGRERIVPFADGSDGFGLLHEPEGLATALVVFVNAGIVHRVGPHRLYVKLARAFAEKGIASFRFDLSGLGDAPVPTSDYEEQAIQDTRRAIESAISTLKAPCAVNLLGLCSGSEVAYKTACAEDRVGGLILLDPHSYPCRSAKIENLTSKVTDFGRMARALGRVVTPSKPDTHQQDAPELIQVIDRPDPPREVWAADLAALTKRGVNIYIRYTRFVEEDLTAPSHFFEAFSDTDLHNRVSVDVDRAADHTYTPLAAQERLIEACQRWIRDKSHD